jgi:uncharacterized protein
MNRVLADTGPFVAVLSPNDQFHEECVAALRLIDPPLYTCWPVLTEAAWLLRSDPGAVEALMLAGGAGLYKILTLGEEDAEGIAKILKQYRNLKAQLADAALVYLARREGIETVFTLDQRDFRIYRSAAGRVFRIIPSP